MRRLLRVFRVGVPLALLVVIGLLCLMPFPRLYLCARFGSTDAMYDLAIQYASSSKRVVNPNPIKHDYWLRKAAKHGNINALIFMTHSWNISNPHEVVYWLKHGCSLGIPWCAEELVRGYESRLYLLPFDHNKILEYDNLAVELHLKNGTLNNHACALVPWVSNPSSWPRVLPKEIHPGIPRESAPVNPAAVEERKRQIQRSAPQGQELVEALKQLEPVKQQALKGDVFAMADLALRYARLGEPHFKTATEWYERAAKAGDAESAMKLVEAYRDGALGLPKDPAKSDAWFKIWQHNESMQPIFNRLSITQITPKAKTPPQE